MTRKETSRFGTLATSLAFLAVSIVGSTGLASAEENSHSHTDLNHGVIRIDSKQIHPKIAHLGADDAIIWANYGEHVAFVTFPGDVAQHLTCAGPSNFTLDGGKLRSTALHGNEFASVCHFEKGSYEYEVSFVNIAPDPTRSRVLKGELVVE